MPWPLRHALPAQRMRALALVYALDLSACGCAKWPMPERDAATCNLGDGFLLIAAGLRREKSGDLTADLMLQNGKIIYADRGVLNTVEGRRSWASAAHEATQDTDGPTA